MEAPEHGITMDTPVEPDGRLRAFGNQLIEVHMWLREELDRLRANVDSHLDGGERTRNLRAHCLTFCSALDRHHNGEDGVAFPTLAEQFPQLRPVLEELERDHRLVAEMLRRLEDLADRFGTGDRAATKDTRNELEGLAALLESHFTYEEKRVVAALNSLIVPEWDGSRPDFLLTTPPSSEAHPSQ
ncbi:hypothetical protein Pth03_70990 [Planotetraspora thailandica]|uniref:Hemerythrin-like domain-containing protein n=2 Tax=Planotetraspora thailandica TaxID=487172 RepID=A0A8J4DEF4_9ACTN|nr:hypothetical protein Pth03_70990 [Planotetraspora thailandica]